MLAPRGAALKAGGEPGLPEEVEVVMRDRGRRSLPTAARNTHSLSVERRRRPPRTEAEEAKAAEEELADDPTSIPLPMEQEQPPNVTERPVLHQTYVEAEGEYAAVDTRPVKLEAKEKAASARRSASRCGRYVCMGTAAAASSFGTWASNRRASRASWRRCATPPTP